GHGCRQRRIKAAETDRTGSIAAAIAKDKALSKRLLRSAGIPVPPGRAVENAEDAWQAACEIGPPVAVKPRDGNHGRGVALNLKTREQVLAAYPLAAAEGEQGVLVERFALGAEHRLLVVGDKVVAASRGEPEQVAGDDVHSVRQLVEELNQDPRRGEFFCDRLTKIELDPLALLILEQQHLTPDSVPTKGQTVLIHYNGDLTTDETDDVHPDVAARAVLATKVVGLDVAGVDLVAADIGRPLEDQEGAIVEVNCGPGLAQHLDPLVGKPRPVGDAIASLLFPDGENGRIPILSVTGSSGRTAVAHLAGQVLLRSGRIVGLSSGEGIFVGGRRIESGDSANWAAGRGLLTHPAVETLVFEISDVSIFREGLAFDRCNVAVVTHVAGDPVLGEPDWNDPDKAAQVQRCTVETLNSGGWAVLNAEDARVAGMAAYNKGSALYYAHDERQPLLVAHRAAGGATAFLRDGVIVFGEGSLETPLMALDPVPALRWEVPACGPLEVVAAAAALWKLGLSFGQIRTGLEPP
ncbi:MAG TPA: acetate--CoA ligase family protein, partial [Pirellulales bacterium]|nr:acetate--CoA ligase family protein [Pirellulales bacterium]